MRAVLASGWVAGQGPRGAELEARFAATCGARARGRGAPTAPPRCTWPCIALGVGPGDEVLVADYTYPATGHAVLFTRGDARVRRRPARHLDDRPGRGRRSRRRPGPSGSSPSTPSGSAPTTTRCASSCDAHGPVPRRGRRGRLGRDVSRHAGGHPFGDVGVLLLARGGRASPPARAGVVTTDDAARRERARSRRASAWRARCAGHSRRDLPVPVFDELGYNYKLQRHRSAAIALVQLDRLPDLLAARRRVAERYARAASAASTGLDAARGRPRTATTRGSPTSLTLAPGVSRATPSRVALRARGMQANIGTFASHRPAGLRPRHSPVRCRQTSSTATSRSRCTPTSPSNRWNRSPRCSPRSSRGPRPRRAMPCLDRGDPIDDAQTSPPCSFTGGAGFIGAMSCRSLLVQRGYRVRLLDTMTYRADRAVLEELRGDGATSSSSRATCATAARCDRADARLSTASSTSPPSVDQQELRRPDRERRRSTCVGNHNVFAAAADEGVRRLVFASSRVGLRRAPTSSR